MITKCNWPFIIYKYIIFGHVYCICKVFNCEGAYTNDITSLGGGECLAQAAHDNEGGVLCHVHKITRMRVLAQDNGGGGAGSNVTSSVI